jgi:glycosyltransferase involved in cell wall biosynthesis
MVQDGITGFVVPYNKPYVLAEKILLVLQGNWEQMSVAASNWAKIYTWEYTAKETLAAINFAIA